MHRPIKRRTFLLGAAAGTGLMATGGPGFARLIQGEVPWQPGRASVPTLGAYPASYLTAAERDFVEAATARLIPSDAYGPGAREAGVVDFIDRQLGSFFGRAQNWYMQGPWDEGLDTQGYQARQTPAELYRDAIAAVDAHCLQTLGGRRFAELGEEEQDAVLQALDDEELELAGDVPGKTFFDLLHENAIEGFFCDPLYGGNRDMIGWRVVGFPGARYDYRPYLDHGGAPIELEPVGIMGGPAFDPSRRGGR